MFRNLQLHYIQRRERDSNPRYLSVRRFSRPVLSPTLPSLHGVRMVGRVEISKLRNVSELIASLHIAEREGFEHPVPLSTPVFKTGAFAHSAISPIGETHLVQPCNRSELLFHFALLAGAKLRFLVHTSKFSAYFFRLLAKKHWFRHILLLLKPQEIQI